MIFKIEHWLQLLTTLAGIAVILIPLLGSRRGEAHARGRSLGAAASFLRWPVMLALTILYVLGGIALLHPIPIVLSLRVHISTLITDSLLYFPAAALYLLGYWTLGQMFGISSGFGTTPYQDHVLIRGGPYRFVRHPMYLAVILVAFGALLIFRTWAMVLFSTLSLGIIVRARGEERLLAEEFGKEWEQYSQQALRWFPRIPKTSKRIK